MQHTTQCSQKYISCGSLFQGGNNVSGSADLACFIAACLFICAKASNLYDQGKGTSLDNYTSFFYTNWCLGYSRPSYVFFLCVFRLFFLLYFLYFHLLQILQDGAVFEFLSLLFHLLIHVFFRNSAKKKPLKGRPIGNFLQTLFVILDETPFTS